MIMSGYTLQRWTRNDLYTGWHEVDYTGRWFVERIDDDCTLYVEVFYVWDKYVPVYKTKSYLWRLFERTVCVGRKKQGVEITQYWVKEDELRIVYDNPINQCECMYDQ